MASDADRAWRRAYNLRHKEKRRERRRAVLGRSCKWCPATDDVAPWSAVSTECNACSRQRSRRACGGCGGPLCCGLPCYRCATACPHGFETLIVLEGETDRELMLFRPAAWIQTRTGSLPVAGEPTVITVPHQKFAGWARCNRPARRSV